MATSVHPRPRIPPAPDRLVAEAPAGPRDERSAGEHTVEVSTFSALRTSALVAGLGVVAMIALVLFAGHALRLGWPSTPLRPGEKVAGTADTLPLIDPVGADAGALRHPLPRAGERAHAALSDRRVRRRAERAPRDRGRAPSRGPATVPVPPRDAAPVATAPAGPGTGGAPALPGGDIGKPVGRDSEDNGTVVTNPGPPADEVPGFVPVPDPELPTAPLEP